MFFLQINEQQGLLNPTQCISILLPGLDTVAKEMSFHFGWQFKQQIQTNLT